MALEGGCGRQRALEPADLPIFSRDILLIVMLGEPYHDRTVNVVIIRDSETSAYLLGIVRCALRKLTQQVPRPMVLAMISILRDRAVRRGEEIRS